MALCENCGHDHSKQTKEELMWAEAMSKRFDEFLDTLDDDKLLHGAKVFNDNNFAKYVINSLDSLFTTGDADENQRLAAAVAFFESEFGKEVFNKEL